MDAPSKGWTAGAVTLDILLNRRQTVRIGAGAMLAQIRTIGCDGKSEFVPLRLDGLTENARSGMLRAVGQATCGRRSWRSCPALHVQACEGAADQCGLVTEAHGSRGDAGFGGEGRSEQIEQQAEPAAQNNKPAVGPGRIGPHPAHEIHAEAR